MIRKRRPFGSKKQHNKALRQRSSLLDSPKKNGSGVEQDLAVAMELYGKAARQGFALAQFRLGLLHAAGRGAERDLVQAYVWFSTAAIGLSNINEDWAATAARNRDMFGQTMSPEQLSAAHELLKDSSDIVQIANSPSPFRLQCVEKAVD